MSACSEMLCTHKGKSFYNKDGLSGRPRSQDAGGDVPEPVVERKLTDEIKKLANIKASSKIGFVKFKTHNYKIYSDILFVLTNIQKMKFDSTGQWIAFCFLMER